ncbi:MAG: tRNA dimethylallyltransferase [Microgenomates group bacterium Gr01-1014_16]|nr:MAG: tRNA dimethylallyltransferase [Microgenomates group bacterium Gr01-1014_16]
MNKVLVICGPTATGKTKFGIEVAKKFDGEIISADSRQVFTGKNLIHGKDLPPNTEYRISNIEWRNKKLKYYEIEGVKIWLYDIVEPGEDFSVAYWKECADLVIADILSRKKLPIVVGGTGLYLKSLSQNLNQISIPPNSLLREKLNNKSPKYLFNYLNRLDSFRAAKLNVSDRQNPRRLIRAIEISLSKLPSPRLGEGRGVRYLQFGLTAAREHLYERVNRKITDRINLGAASEDPDLAAHPAKWQGIEHGIVRHQLTWFKKQPGITWFDITRPNWQSQGIIKISSCLKQ